MGDFRLAQVSILHHIKGLTQQEIAGKLGYSKMTVSRMLQRARESGVVETSVSLPYKIDQDLSERLRVAYDLQRVLVIDTEDMPGPSNRIGAVCAFELGVSISDGDTIGVGIGQTIGSMVEAVQQMRMQDVHIVQLMGGYTEVSEDNPLNIVQVLCQKLGATGSYIALSAYLESAKAKRVLFDDSALGREIMRRWSQCSKALFGIGSVKAGSTLAARYGGRTSSEPQRAVGEILGHYFAADGTFLAAPLDERLVSIPVDTMLAIPERTAVAGGVNDAAAVDGALRTGSITHLIIDSTTADRLRGIGGA